MLDHHYNDGLPAGLGVIVRVFLSVSITLEPLWQCCGGGGVDIVTGFWGFAVWLGFRCLWGFAACRVVVRVSLPKSVALEP
ncbi:hypothetical protein Hanom_Chr11g00970571 [Helianthus anomalus]